MLTDPNLAALKSLYFLVKSLIVFELASFSSLSFLLASTDLLNVAVAIPTAVMIKPNGPRSNLDAKVSAAVTDVAVTTEEA